MGKEKYLHHQARHWSDQHRSVTVYTVKKVTDLGDSWQFSTTDRTSFIRSKRDVPHEFHPGDQFILETIGWSNITGLAYNDGEWLFRLSDEDLAREAREWHEKCELELSERLDRNHRMYAQLENDLPSWLRARLARFHEAAGDKFKREGWGYELAICRLADLLDRDRKDDADALASELGASGNQWDCAQALARFRKQDGDEVAVRFPAGMAPITGSSDYS